MTAAAWFPWRLLAAARIAAVILAAGSAATACGILPDKNPDPTYVEGSVEQLYNTGLDLLNKGEYTEAAKYFNEIDRQHPYSTWAARSQLMVAYAHYKALDYDTAILTLNRFTRLHPGHRDIAYAYYLKALCNFEQVRDIKRDQSNTRDAINGFTIVARRYPSSKYAEDARRKIAVLYDHLAGAEMEVGRFYEDRHQYLAAISRFKTVVQKYQGSRHVPEALHRLTESYTALGLRDEARRTAAVLGLNFPKSRWYAYSYALIQGHGVSRVRVPKQTPPKKAPAKAEPAKSAPPPPGAEIKATREHKAAPERKAAPDAAPPISSPESASKAAPTSAKTPKPARRSFFRRAIDWVF